MKKMIISLILLLSLLLNSGCWDIRDVSNRAFVTAIGLDAVEGAEPLKYKVTFEIVKPLGLKYQSFEPATIVETIEAESIGKAMEQLQSKISRTITLSHLRLLIIGDKLARRNFKDTSNFFEKHPEVALRLRLDFVQDGQAQDILNAKPRFEKSISGEYVAVTQLEKDFSLMRTRRFYDFVSDLRSSNGNGFATRVYRPANVETTVHEGGAVFKEWKLTGWLNGDETQAANWITGRGKATVAGKTEQGVYTYQVNKKSVRLTPVNKNGQLRYRVKLKTYGNVNQEQGEQLDLSNPQNTDKLEKVFSRVIAGQVRGAVHKAQKELGVDYLGLGKNLKQHDPKTFDSINWAEIFPNVPVSVEVESNISTFGLAR